MLDRTRLGFHCPPIPSVLTRCSEDTARSRTPALRLAYSARRLSAAEGAAAATGDEAARHLAAAASTGERLREATDLDAVPTAPPTGLNPHWIRYYGGMVLAADVDAG